MYETTVKTRALRLRESAARKARGALAATIVAAAFVVPPLAAGLVAPPAHASTTFLVTNTNDSGAGSLRQAILDANATTDADAIKFAIPGTGVQTIKPSTPLPPITRPVTIDGYTQKDAHPNTKTVGDDAVLKVELDGINVPNDNGLEISTSDGSVIRGLVINRFGEGVFVHGDSVANRIEGNFIGTNPTGTLDKGNNFDGVSIDGGASENVVGGATPDKRNVISGNSDGGGIGVFVGNSINRVQGNYVGTDKSGTKDLGNNFGGINVIDASGTMVGGTTAASRNVVSGNDDVGITIVHSQATKLLGNRIGTTAGGAGALGNDLEGVNISGSSGTLLGDGTTAGSNTVAFNGRDGINVNGTTAEGNQISHNSIFSNAGLGVDLTGPGELAVTTSIPTKNDAGDTDSGPNNLQNKPVISSATTGPLKTTIKGKLDSTPSTTTAKKTFTIEFFSNPTDTNEGKKFIGETTVTTSVDGLASFTLTPAAKVAVGRTITATATNSSTHDTSEFSAPRTVSSS
jgi:hypothetical protein